MKTETYTINQISRALDIKIITSTSGINGFFILKINMAHSIIQVHYYKIITLQNLYTAQSITTTTGEDDIL